MCTTKKWVLVNEQCLHMLQTRNNRGMPESSTRCLMCVVYVSVEWS